MPKQHEFTRWRQLGNPISPLDPIQPDGPRYVEGHLPPGFVMVLWDGIALIGPLRFQDQAEADQYLKDHQREILEYIVLPKPTHA